VYYVVTYDVSTKEYEGQRRLRKVAQTCVNYGKRVQYSVFECDVDKKQYHQLQNQLKDIINEEEDTLRFYRIHEPKDDYIEHIGRGEPPDFEDPLVV
jgi:CRISPR-associated protein Cas2